MKILLTCEDYLPRIGGAEIHVMNLYTKLRVLGHDVTLVTNEPSSVPDEISRVIWKKSNIFLLLKILWQQSKGCDIIHAHYCHRLALLVGIIGRVRGIPVIITLHGKGILNHPHTPWYCQKIHAFYRYWSLQFATRIISTSQDLADLAYVYIKKDKVQVIMNGYDPSLFHQVHVVKNDSDKKNIITVRRLVPKNGIQYLVEAMPYLVSKEPNIHYTIVGDGPLRVSLEQRVCELHLETYVTFVGMQQNDVVVSYLTQADAVIFPSTAESSSIACAEAMGMKKMVIASRVGGLVELLGKNQERGILVSIVSWEGSNYDAPATLPVEKYKLLADSIYEGLQNTKENEERRENAYVYATSELTWDSVIQKTVEVYKRLLKK